MASNCIAASVFELFLNQWCLTDLATVVLYDFPTTIDNDKVSYVGVEPCRRLIPSRQ